MVGIRSHDSVRCHRHNGFGIRLIGLLFGAFALISIASASERKSDPLRELERVSIGGIPVVVSHPLRIDKHTRLVVLFHGFGPPGDPDELADAVALDRTSLIGVYVSMPLVGKRMSAGGIDELRRIQTDDFVNGLYFRSISTAVDELPQIVRYIEQRYGVDTSRGIGLFGFSAGGSAALLALTQSDVRISAVVAVNAPLSVRQNVSVWERELKRDFVWDEESREAASRYDVFAHAKNIADRKPRPSILLMQGDQDEHLAVEPMLQTCAALEKSFGRWRSDVECDVLRGTSHNFGRSAAEMKGESISDGASIANATRNLFVEKFRDRN